MPDIGRIEIDPNAAVPTEPAPPPPPPPPTDASRAAALIAALRQVNHLLGNNPHLTAVIDHLEGQLAG